LKNKIINKNLKWHLKIRKSNAIFNFTVLQQAAGTNQKLGLLTASSPQIYFKKEARKVVLRSRSRKEPHHLVGAGDVTRCGSDGSGSNNGIKHG
jgi:hypothetical protein